MAATPALSSAPRTVVPSLRITPSSSCGRTPRPGSTVSRWALRMIGSVAAAPVQPADDVVLGVGRDRAAQVAQALGHDCADRRLFAGGAINAGEGAEGLDESRFMDGARRLSVSHRVSPVDGGGIIAAAGRDSSLIRVGFSTGGGLDLTSGPFQLMKVANCNRVVADVAPLCSPRRAGGRAQHVAPLRLPPELPQSGEMGRGEGCGVRATRRRCPSGRRPSPATVRFLPSRCTGR